MDACPYDVIYFNNDLNISQKCAFYAHLLVKGWKEPRCVDVCPTDALIFGEEEDLKDLMDRSEILRPELNTRPRNYYMGLPKIFIAGAVYDPSQDECFGGAAVTLKDLQSGEQKTTATDEFGGFWFQDLKDGNCALSTEQEEYKPNRIKSCSTERSMNLGDIALFS